MTTGVVVDLDTESLIVFTRCPQPGQTKTRMIPLLGPAGAAELQRHMAAHTLAQARLLRQQRKTRIVVRYAGGTPEAMACFYGNDLPFLPQADGDIGRRMLHAARAALDEGSRAVVIVGSDCPDLSADTMAAALKALCTCDVVLGPAMDGGYYLIGLRQAWPGLFEHIAWGTETVFRQTVEAAARLGLSVHHLPALHDVDRPEDLPVWQRVRDSTDLPGNLPAISVIIPALNEEACIARAVHSAQADGHNVEVIVVDGGSTDRTTAIAESCGARVTASQPGRGRQMNAGAALAGGTALVFLHADSQLPAGFASDVRRILALPNTAAGAFTLAIAPDSPAFRVIAAGANLRAKWLRKPYGDQALFLRRDIFSLAGGFAEILIMEDVDFLRRLRRHGVVRIADAVVRTSGRRWLQQGIVRTTALHQILLVGYWLGVSPVTLHRWRSCGQRATASGPD